MSKNAQPLAKAGELLKKSGSLGLIAIIVVLGVILLLLPSGGNKPVETIRPVTTQEPVGDTAGDFDRRIAAALSKLEGAGKVMVVLSLNSDGEIYLATDRDDKYGSEIREQSEEAVLVNSGSSMQSPVIVKRDYPEYRGALVVAEGADNPTVKLAITQAIASLTGLGSDRVTVVKMQTN